MDSRLFVDLTPEAVAQTERFFNQTKRYPPYELIIQEGTADSKLYLLDEGVALIKVAGQEVGEVTAGDVFGEVGFCASGKRTASVFAGAEGVTVRIIPAERFRDFGSKYPELALIIQQNLTFLLASKLQRANQNLRRALARMEELESSRDEEAASETRSPSLLGWLFAGFGST